MVPFALEDRRTAGGCGCPEAGNDVDGTGLMPKARRAGSEDTGNCTGIAPPVVYGG